MATLKQIEEFISSGLIAMVGVSRNPRKFGYTAFRELKEKGMNLIPVNPFTDEILQNKVYRDIKSLPSETKGVIIMTPKKQTTDVIKEAKARGIKQIWIQQMSDTREALAELKDTDINYITGECILMHYKPHSIHKFHAWLMKLFGKYPK